MVDFKLYELEEDEIEFKNLSLKEQTELYKVHDMMKKMSKGVNFNYSNEKIKKGTKETTEFQGERSKKSLETIRKKL